MCHAHPKILVFLSISFVMLSYLGMNLAQATEYRDIKTYTSQNINVNKSSRCATSLPNDIEPSSGVDQIETIDDLVIIQEPEGTGGILTPESVSEDILEVSSDASINVPEEISDMMSEIEVEAGKLARENKSYSLGPDDKIKITVFGEQDLSGEFVISGEDTITFPLIGTLSVDGQTPSELAENIRNYLADGYLKDPNVYVEVIKNRPFYILGEVREPGSYDFVNGMNILQAVAISGGYTYRANRKTIDVMRVQDGNSQMNKMNSEDLVQPGDIIYVRERFF